jgi:hypothetical protein
MHHSYRTVVNDAELVEGIMKDVSADGVLSPFEQDVIDTLFEGNVTANMFMFGIHPDLTDGSHQTLTPNTQLRFNRTPWTQPVDRLVTVSGSVRSSSDEDEPESSDEGAIGCGRAKMPILYYDSQRFSRTEFWKSGYGDSFSRDSTPETKTCIEHGGESM